MALPLTVQLQANLDAFDASMRQAGERAGQQAMAIEKKFKDINPHLDLSKLFSGAAAGVGGIAGVLGIDKMLDMLVGANKQMADLAETAKKASVTTDQFQSLRFAAGQGGVSDETFGTDIVDLAKKLNDAKSQENDLTKLFDDNGKQWKNTKGEVIGVSQALSTIADLVKNARNELDKFRIADLVGLSKDWVKALEPGGDAFDKTAAAAKDAGVVIDRETIQKADAFTRQWNAAGAIWSAELRANISTVIPLLDTLVTKASGLLASVGAAAEQLGSVGRLLAAGGDVGGLSTKDLQNTLKELEGLKHDFGTQQLFGGPSFQLFDTKTIDASIDKVKARLAELKAASPADDKPHDLPALNVNGTKLRSSYKDASDKKDAFDNEENRLKRSIALREAEAASIGKTESAREALKAEVLLLQAAEKSGDAVTVEQIATYAELRKTMTVAQALDASGAKLTDAHAKSLQDFSDRAAKAGAAIKKAEDAFGGINDAAKFAGNQAVDVIDGLINKTETWGQAVSNTARLIEKELLRAALTGEGAFAKLLGTNSAVAGAPGGLFGIPGALRP